MTCAPKRTCRGRPIVCPGPCNPRSKATQRKHLVDKILEEEGLTLAKRPSDQLFYRSIGQVTSFGDDTSSVDDISSTELTSVVDFSLVQVSRVALIDQQTSTTQEEPPMSIDDRTPMSAVSSYRLIDLSEEIPTQIHERMESTTPFRALVFISTATATDTPAESRTSVPGFDETFEGMAMVSLVSPTPVSSSTPPCMRPSEGTILLIFSRQGIMRIGSSVERVGRSFFPSLSYLKKFAGKLTTPAKRTFAGRREKLPCSMVYLIVAMIYTGFHALLALLAWQNPTYHIFLSSQICGLFALAAWSITGSVPI